jgi:hypothetical protein
LQIKSEIIFNLFLLGVMPWVMGVSHSEKWIKCKNYYWVFLGLLDGLELGSEDDEWQWAKNSGKELKACT